MQRKSTWRLGPGALRTVLLAGALGASAAAHALEVGSLRLERESGKPLRAEVPLTDRGPVVAADLRVRIAARETFEVAGLRYHPGLAKVQVQARQLPNGKAVLVLEGLPTDSPQFDLLLTVSDRASLTIAEYRIDTQAPRPEFPPARAGSSLAAQQKGSAAAGKAGDSRSVEVKLADPKPASAPAPVAGPAAASRPTQAPAAAAADPRPALTAAVQSWAEAWSRRDVRAYLDAYAPGFVSADRTLSYEAWAAQRRQRILARKRIEVRIEALELEPKGSDWVASFAQHYQGDAKTETTRKQLLLRQIEGRWLIVGEREDR